MNSPIRLTCPHCQRQGSTSKALKAGSRIRCPGCGESFVYTDPNDVYVAPSSRGEVEIIVDETGRSLNLNQLENITANQNPADYRYFPEPSSHSSPLAGVESHPSSHLPAPLLRSPSPTELPSVAAPPPLPSTVTKNCVYCGEEILAAALKCKHCGEFIDPVLRAAEEAKALARQNASIVNVNTAVSTNVKVGGRRLSRLVGIGLILIVAAPFLSALVTSQLGILLGFAGVISLGVGLIVTLVRFFF